MTARMRLQPEAIGMGMTSQRVRDRLIDRLRDNGIRDERVLNAIPGVEKVETLGGGDRSGTRPPAEPSAPI